MSTPETDPVRPGHIADQSARRSISFRTPKRGPRPSCQLQRRPVERAAPASPPWNIPRPPSSRGAALRLAPGAGPQEPPSSLRRRMGRPRGTHTTDEDQAPGKAIATPGNRASVDFHRSIGMSATLVPDYAGPGQDRVVFYADLLRGCAALRNLRTDKARKPTRCRCRLAAIHEADQLSTCWRYEISSPSSIA